MSDYLEEAAALLRKVAMDNEKTLNQAGYARLRSEINEGRERIAKGFAVLAAIDKGLLPAPAADDLAVWMTEASQHI